MEPPPRPQAAEASCSCRSSRTATEQSLLSMMDREKQMVLSVSSTAHLMHCFCRTSSSSRVLHTVFLTLMHVPIEAGFDCIACMSYNCLQLHEVCMETPCTWCFNGHDCALGCTIITQGILSHHIIAFVCTNLLSCYAFKTIRIVRNIFQ